MKCRTWLNETDLGANETAKYLPKAHGFGKKDVVYAAQTNKERNSISTGNFKQHTIQFHPFIDSLDDPPVHTTIIKTDMFSLASKEPKDFMKSIRGIQRHRVLTTCGDDNILQDTKHVNYALCCYMGGHLLCTIGNGNLTEDVSGGNDTRWHGI